MADVAINYEGNEIASMSASGTKTLLTAGKYCADDIEVVYTSPGGGGGLDYPWLTSHETVTIGANSITNMDQAKTFFNSYSPYYIVSLKTAPNTYNQVVALMGSASPGAGLRYRSGTISQVTVSSAYDGVLVEGTQYEIYHY